MAPLLGPLSGLIQVMVQKSRKKIMFMKRSEKNSKLIYKFVRMPIGVMTLIFHMTTTDRFFKEQEINKIPLNNKKGYLNLFIQSCTLFYRNQRLKLLRNSAISIVGFLCGNSFTDGYTTANNILFTTR